MRLRLIILALFLVNITFANADKTEKIRLDDKHTSETKDLKFCNIVVSKTGTDNNGTTMVSIEIENKDTENVILLFDKSYSKRDLKKQKPSKSFHKTFPGTERIVEGCDGISEICLITPTKKKDLPVIVFKEPGTKSLLLPFYISKFKKKSFFSFLGGSNGRNKLQLFEAPKVELQIELGEREDEDLKRITEKSDKLIKEIEQQTFCTNPRHKPSLAEQKESYKEQIDYICDEIKDINSKRYLSYDKNREKFESILKRLEAIDFAKYEKDCGKHSIPTSNCKYCKLSPQKIYHMMDDFYKKIYNSDNRKEAKEAIMSDVKLLFECKKHASKWKNSEYSERITDRYNRINNF